MTAVQVIIGIPHSSLYEEVLEVNNQGAADQPDQNGWPGDTEDDNGWQDGPEDENDREAEDQDTGTSNPGRLLT